MAEERLWRIWSNEHKAWWKSAACGYTVVLAEAGFYTEDDALEICRRALIGSPQGGPPNEVMVRTNQTADVVRPA